MARLTLASYTSAKGLGEGQLSPLQPRHGPQCLSKLELLQSAFQERTLQEKERKMLQMLTQQQERISHRITGSKTLQPPEEKAWAANWTVAKRTAGVDRAHLLQPVYPHKVLRSPSATAATIQPSLPNVRSKSGPSRPDQWQQLEKRERNLEGEIRRKEAILREKLRRTEQELRRIQKEKEQSEWEERAQETHDPKRRPRRTKLEEGGSGGRERTTIDRTEATRTNPLSRDQIRGEGERTTSHRTEATRTNPLSVDQIRGGKERATSDRTEATRTITLSIDQIREGRERTTSNRTETTRTNALSIDQIRGGRERTTSNSQLSKDRWGREQPARVEAEDHLPSAGGRGGGYPAATQGVGTFYQPSPAAPCGQDMSRPLSDHLEETLLHGSVPQDPGQPLAQCQWCGRHFMGQRLHRHAAVCEKTRHSKRKVFDSSKARSKGTDLEPYLQKKGNRSSPAPEVKVCSWRQTHESFLRTIRQARVVQHPVARGGRMPDRPPPEENPHYVPCPHCSRRFAPRAAERHIPKCETIKSKPRPPPSRR